MKSFYDILGLPRNATARDIKAAYGRLSKERHPDKGGSDEAFVEIGQAYEVCAQHVSYRSFNDILHNPFPPVHTCGLTLQNAHDSRRSCQI